MKILQICHKPAYPPIDGSSIAMYNLTRGLIKNGHQVHTVAINTYKQYCNIEAVPEWFKEETKYTLIDVDIRVKILPAFINLFTNKSYNISRFDSDEVREELGKILEQNTYDLVILESLYTTSYINLLRKKIKGPIVLRSHNVEFKIWESLSKNEKNLLKKLYLQILTKRLKKYELDTIKKMDLIATISDIDRLTFRNEECTTPMEYIPFGINFNDEEFRSYHSPEKSELVFFHVGSMDWLPHQEGFKWFFDEVWPELIKNNPNAKLYLAGSKMPDWMRKGNFSNVSITNDYVDGKTFMNKKAIMVVPSFSGSGIRVKIAEGMAKGKVIITTVNGAMGIPVSNNENIFISDNSKDWIAILSRCNDDLEVVKEISKNAREFAQNEFNYETAANKLIQSLKELNINKQVRAES